MMSLAGVWLLWGGRPAQSAEGAYRVVTVDLTQESLLLLGQAEEVRSFEAAHAHLQSIGRAPRALTNAGIFESPRDPTGLQVEQGRATSPLNLGDGAGNFYLKPGGVFEVTVSGQARVVSSASWASGPEVWLATQSGPLLLHQGAIHPAFQPDSENRRRRSGVCASTPTTVHLFVSTAEVRFYDMAVFARDTLGCQDALYLDGVISQLWVAEDGRPPRSQDYAGILAVVPRAAAP